MCLWQVSVGGVTIQFGKVADFSNEGLRVEILFWYGNDIWTNTGIPAILMVRSHRRGEGRHGDTRLLRLPLEASRRTQ
jgi:hypothetical protein